MLNAEQNKLLTETGPGTPCGDLMRRYWQPVALAEEVPPGGGPVAVRLFGEDLVLFRDHQGFIGLLGLRCAHRGTDLSYGRIENGGLRCLYHGWLYDRQGRCVEQPGEPDGSAFRSRYRHRAYPCHEVSGIVFTYMGPGEAPLFPNYPFNDLPATHTFVAKVFQDCNYLQGNEGNLDPQHISILHRIGPEEETNADDPALAYQKLFSLGSADATPRIEFEETDFGLRILTSRNINSDAKLMRVQYFIIPNACSVPAGKIPIVMHWHVPIDDTHHFKYIMHCSPYAPLDQPSIAALQFPSMEDGYVLKQNPTNRFMQDRREIVTGRTFAGLGRDPQVHDMVATASQGPIQDRSEEHLGYTDKVIVAARRQLIREVENVRKGNEPIYVIRDEHKNDLSHMKVSHMVVSGDRDVTTYWQSIADDERVVVV